MKLKNVYLHKPFLFYSFILFFQVANAQDFKPKNYPQGYFAYPVGAKVGLAANFGELRPNHYHMGLDCKTDKKQNLPVLASADGYIAHVRIDESGFGRAIYINHPNGLTTLYGHLNDFFPELEVYVKAQQYKQETWAGFFDIPEEIFPVTKGQFIGYSGNTGGSQGPHLHFEIRDTKTDKVLNPLLFGFPIMDDVPPSIIRLAVYDRCFSTYNQTPKLFNVKLVKGIYQPPLPLIIVNTDKVSFGISAFDKYTGSSNPNGIYEATLFDNSKGIVGFQLDSISYDETRYLNAHIDYRIRSGGGPFIEHLSRLPGYPEGVYKDFTGDGVIDITDNSLHNIKIVVKDTYGNQSILQFQIKRSLLLNEKVEPDSLSFYRQKEFHPGFINIFDKEEFQIILGEHALYDSISFAYSKKLSLTPKSISNLHIVQSASVPVQDTFIVRIKPDKILAYADTGKIILQRTINGRTEIIKPVREGDWFTGNFRSFGNFQLLIDDTPPVITPLGFRENANLTKASQIAFRMKDDNGSVKNFRAELDGKWLRFTNDKELAFIYKFDEMCPAGNHELKVSVQDEAGNASSKIFHFIR